MPRRDVSIAVVGSGGDGVVTLGDLVAQAAAKEGLHVIKTEAYGPQIRGGESSWPKGGGRDPRLPHPRDGARPGDLPRLSPRPPFLSHTGSRRAPI